MSKRTDISQLISKYLNGELDAHAMHQLEREALNDPFLAEALEGYEKAGSNQEQHLSDIHTRLQDRITEKRRRIVLWRTISIAASILIVLTIGGLWLKNQHIAVKPNLVAQVNKAKTTAPVNKPKSANDTIQEFKKSALIADNKKNAGTAANAHLPVKVKPGTSAVAEVVTTNAMGIKKEGQSSGYNTTSIVAPEVHKKDSSLIAMQLNGNSLDKVVVIGYGTKKKGTITGSVDTIKPASIKQKNNVAFNGLSGKVAGVQVTTGRKTVTGTVVAKEDGLPIPGVTVKIKGTNTATQTNSSGQFTINSVPDGSTLDIAFIGYDSQHILVHKKDSLTIAMQASSNSLNEVVVTTAMGISSQDEEYQSARPYSGWSDYKQYLKDNAISPDGKTGVVRLSFIVNTDDSLTDFKIIKSVSAKTDSAAIDLVKNGPEWMKSTNNKPQKVRLRIKFTGK